MPLLSIDVGIRNLAYCKIDNDQILEWNVVDLYETIESFEKEWVACVYKTWKVPKLKECLVSWNVPIEPKITRANLLKLVEKSVKGISKTFAPDVLARILIKHFDSCKELYQDCQEIYIENQPSLKNPHMKSVQIILLTYFVMRNIQIVKFVHASLKLKYAIKQKWTKAQKMSYREGKKIAVEVVVQNILPNQTDIVQNFFNGHSKKDDLADCALQALAAKSKNI